MTSASADCGRPGWIRIQLGATTGEATAHRLKFWSHGGDSIVWEMLSFHKLLDVDGAHPMLKTWLLAKKALLDEACGAVGVLREDHFLLNRKAYKARVTSSATSGEPEPKKPRFWHDEFSMTTLGVFVLLRACKQINRKAVKERSDELRAAWLLVCCPNSARVDLQLDRMVSDTIAAECQLAVGAGVAVNTVGIVTGLVPFSALGDVFTHHAITAAGDGATAQTIVGVALVAVIAFFKVGFAFFDITAHNPITAGR